MYGVSFRLFTNHKSLKYIYTHKDLNIKQRKWLVFLAEYNINIAYHPGKANLVADALRRRPIVYGARLATMGIRYEDQREDVAERYLVVVLVRLKFSSMIAKRIRQAQKAN